VGAYTSFGEVDVGNGTSATRFIQPDGSSGFVLAAVLSLQGFASTDGNRLSRAADDESLSFSAVSTASSSLGRAAPYVINSAAVSARIPNSLASSNSNNSSRQFFSPVFNDRILPSIPPFLFGENDVVPACHTPDSLGSIPLSVYRQRRLMRACGILPSTVSLPPSLTPPLSEANRQLNRQGQFSGSISYGSWNSQAFFCTNLEQHAEKFGYLCSLMSQHDAMALQEVHGTLGTHMAFRSPLGCTSFFSAGASYGTGGIGLVVRDSFLAKFDPHPTWKVLWKGRAACLRLSGPHGSLDLYTAYFHTGAQVTEGDKDGAYPSVRNADPTFRDLRNHLRKRIADAFAPKHETLSMLAADFNYVNAKDDRYNVTTMRATGAGDREDEQHFQRFLASPFSLVEAHQPLFTHKVVTQHGTSMGRLDRIYTNQHVLEQLDRQIRTSALPWQHSLSAHRAISFSRKIPDKRTDGGISIAALRHVDFPRRTRLAYDALLREHPEAGALRRLALYKQALLEVSDHLKKDPLKMSPVETTEEQLSVTMQFIRTFERGFSGALAPFLHLYPAIASYMPNRNPYAGSNNPSLALARLRDHALELARQQALEDMESADAMEEDNQGEHARRRKARAARLLFRLAPGKSGQIGAIRGSSGQIVYEFDNMARILRLHWADVFKGRPIDEDTMRSRSVCEVWCSGERTFSRLSAWPTTRPQAQMAYPMLSGGSWASGRLIFCMMPLSHLVRTMVWTLWLVITPRSMLLFFFSCRRNQLMKWMALVSMFLPPPAR